MAASYAVAQDPEAVSVKDGAAAADSPLADGQTQLAKRFKKLEGLLLRSAEVEAATNPTRAALMQQAAALAKQVQLSEALVRAARSLEQKQYSQAIEDQKASLENLNKILELLQSENRADRVREQRDQIKRTIEETERLLRLESSLRGRTEGGIQAEKAASDQQKLAEKAAQIAKDLDPESKDSKDGEDSKSGQDNAAENNGKNKDEKSEDEKNKSGKEKSDKPDGADKKSDGQDGKDQKDGGSKDQTDKNKSGDQPSEDTKDKNPADKKAEPPTDKKSDDKKSDDKNSDGEKSKPSSNQDKDGKDKSGQDKDGKDKDGKDKDGKDSNDSKDGKDGKDNKGDSKSQEGQSQPNKPGDQSQQESSESQQSGEQQNSSEQSQQPQKPKSPTERASQSLKKAQKQMQEAQKNLEEANREGAVEKQRQAEQELKTAIEELEEILRQLREEEIERSLTALEERLRLMLQLQNKVLDESKRLQEIGAGGNDRQVEIRANNLSNDEKKIVNEAQRALLLLREEGTSAAFPESLSHIISDMQKVVDRLAKADVGKLTIGIEEDIVASLEELVAAMSEIKKENKERKENQMQVPGQQGQPGEQPLVNQLAEMRLIKTLQIRINKRTQTLAEVLKDPSDPVGQAEAEDIQGQLRELAERQSSIKQVTRDIVIGKNQQ